MLWAWGLRFRVSGCRVSEFRGFSRILEVWAFAHDCEP